MTNREIDALVAEKVMGCSVTRVGYCGCSGSPHTDDEGYPLAHSTSIEAAWEVVEKLKNRKPLTVFNLTTDGRDYIASFYTYRGGPKADCAYDRADTAPMAICLAALKSVGVDIP